MSKYVNLTPRRLAEFSAQHSQKPIICSTTTTVWNRSTLARQSSLCVLGEMRSEEYFFSSSSSKTHKGDSNCQWHILIAWIPTYYTA